ncbi:hypothetical protein D9756_004634 [Leucocoprinus leucothites]|uniref:DUF4203 domain-containing protein n=1 Tax=Leucocoprinus leucothites TaxID=201217 RepID=A0A8H5G9A2_9AGAR|nr:hypothetical protein D9756_004634 [Leucoagaricus leucothites]
MQNTLAKQPLSGTIMDLGPRDANLTHDEHKFIPRNIRHSYPRGFFPLLCDTSTINNFPTDYSALPGTFDKNKKRKFAWFLEGGVGGLACGYTTGRESNTLALDKVLNVLNTSPCGFIPLACYPNENCVDATIPKSFLAVWIFVCIFTTLLAGRYRYAALTMAGISGGALASLALCVIIHPSLTPRVVLIAISVPLLTFLVLLFYFVPKFHSWLLHPTLRFCTSSNGAFGIILSISLLLNPKVEAWANVWERLWLQDGDSWGTGKEKGLSAAFCIFLVVGAATDWALRRWIGECPDEKWDNYLANYMANLPSQADRAGIFEPPKSFWGRFFDNDKRDPILFPPDSDLKVAPQSPSTLNDHSPPLSKSLAGGLIKKPRSHSRKYGFQSPATRKRKPVKFGALDELSSLPNHIPPLSYSSSTPTLVDEPPKALRKQSTNTVGDPAKPLVIDYEAELAQLKKLKGSNGNLMDGMLDYSDHEEEDLTSISQRRSMSNTNDQSPGRWSPAFIKRHSSGLSISADPGSPAIPFPGSAPVPATPSLIKAMDRIAIAQRDAFGPVTPSPFIPASTSATPTGDARNSEGKQLKLETKGLGYMPERQRIEEEEEEDNARAVERARKERAPRWEEFWREVRAKAHS